MRSKLVICAALAGNFLVGGWSPVVRAESKGKSAKGSKAKASDGLTDDKTISKQMQWEDSVMGPDDKRAELDKIARAQAINKAAQEKAARDKEKADAAAAREAAAPKPQTAKRGGDVAIPSVPDEAPKKVETAEAPPPPKPVKHGDDKFIDKLLKDEPGSKKHSSVDDKALNDLLAVDKPTAAKPKRKDDVDSLLQSADKAPPMPETHAKKELPEWAKPEIQSTPQPTPVVLRTQPKRNDGVIRVVQGAATPARNVTPPPAPARTSAVATRVPPANGRHAAAADSSWNDPFAEAPKKAVAARDTRHSSDFDDDFTASPRRRPAPAAAARPTSRGSDDFDDPPKEAPKASSGSRRAAPAAKPANKWKDPFTEDRTTTKAAHHKVAARGGAKPHHDRVQLAAAEPRGGWGILKKR
ncbi:MAG TPA: hypothetical protein VHO67_15495 [Polyangia bacterium]|nr:hypothetical protein [Polyangia bacterium]